FQELVRADERAGAFGQRHTRWLPFRAQGSRCVGIDGRGFQKATGLHVLVEKGIQLAADRLVWPTSCAHVGVAKLVGQRSMYAARWMPFSTSTCRPVAFWNPLP